MTAADARASHVRSLYVHIPFCERKCEYCDFTSIAGKHREHDYVAGLRRELTTLAERVGHVELDTVFVGGGTPSFIEPRLLADIVDQITREFTLSAGAEITLEANPSSTSVERASVWREAGFNRISLGIQSLEPDCLRFLGRVHDATRALDAVGEARRAGFESINCDLIYAIPGLDDSRWRRTLDQVIALEPAHVSCYELTVESGTPLHAAVRRGRVQPVAARPALAQHWMAVDALSAAGYRQYEVSNFAQQGSECRHNLAYWRNEFYLAAGLGAHGHVPAAWAAALDLSPADGAVAVRYWHGRGVGAYIDSSLAGSLPITGSEQVGAPTHEMERRMLGLRLAEGVPFSGVAIREEVATLIGQGLLALEDGRLRATRRGQAVLDRVVVEVCEGLAA